MSSRPAVHPFPARMAPELVEQQLDGFKGHRVVLDPMMGSGSFIIAAARRGHFAIGVDSDPLTHVIARTAAGCYDASLVIEEASRIVKRIKSGATVDPEFDPETDEFVDFWFDKKARRSLGSIAHGIDEAAQDIQAPLWCAFSRLIITKDSGASRARDVSHSRPHRTREFASFDPLDRFEKSAQVVVQRAAQDVVTGSLSTIRGDARNLPLPAECVNGVMTSPPYLTAIDYLRGHRMSLVWMGYTVKDLRRLRSENIGSERGANVETRLADIIASSVDGVLPDRKLRTINRYVGDLEKTLGEIYRVLRPGGFATLVVANSMHSSIPVSAEIIVSGLAKMSGFRLASRFERILPTNRRYLPPPGRGEGNLDRRMHAEVILKFAKR